MTAVREVIADRGDAGRRVDLVLRRRLQDEPQASRTRVQTWITNGDVTVNDRQVTRVSRRVALGDRIRVVMTGARPRFTMAPEPLPVTVLLEDDHLLVVDKPAGVVTHPTYRHMTGTLMNAVLWQARSWPAEQRPSIVGRLDKQTSGLVVIAKTRAVHAALQKEFGAASSEKLYLAVVQGRVTRRSGTISLRLARDARDRRRVVASPIHGLASETRFVRLSSSRSSGTPRTLLRCRLVTGRMHQIRVHLAAQGWPIVGDVVYGDRSTELFPRQALHAWRLTLRHPITGRRLTVEAPIPGDLAALLAASGLEAPR